MARRDDPFARVPKSMLDDSSLSWKAKGLLSYLLGKPAGWKLLVSDLVNRGCDGKAAVRSGLNELRAAGYAEYVEGRSSEGKFAPAVWKISDSPIFSPRTSFPDAVFPDAENRHLSKNELTKNDSTKKETAAAVASGLEADVFETSTLHHAPPQDLRLSLPPSSARPPKPPPRRREPPRASDAGREDAEFFRSLLPPMTSLEAGWQDIWGAAFDRMASDGRNPDEVRRVCRWARKDSFWSPHVLSPVRLVKRKDGSLLYDRLLAAMLASTAVKSCEPKM